MKRAGIILAFLFVSFLSFGANVTRYVNLEVHFQIDKLQNIT